MRKRYTETELDDIFALIEKGFSRRAIGRMLNRCEQSIQGITHIYRHVQNDELIEAVRHNAHITRWAMKRLGKDTALLDDLFAKGRGIEFTAAIQENATETDNASNTCDKKIDEEYLKAIPEHLKSIGEQLIAIAKVLEKTF